MNTLQLLYLAAAAEEEEGTAVSKAGFFADHITVIGIILAVVGIGVIYVGIKLLKGYSFHVDETVVSSEKDDYVPLKAQVLGQRSTKMPDLSGSGEEKLISEIRLRYEYEDTVYTEWVLGSGAAGDTLSIRCSPDDPKDFYIDDEPEEAPAEEKATEEEPEGNKSVGTVLIIIGIMLAVVGAGIAVDGFMR